MVLLREMFPEGFVPSPAAIAPASDLTALERARAAVVVYAERIKGISARIPTAKLESDQQAHDVNSLLSLAKIALADMDDARRKILEPLAQETKAINDLFHPLTKAVEDVKTKCDPLVYAYIKAKQAEQERQRLEGERLRIAAEQKEVEARIAAESAKTEQERQAKLREASDAMQEQAFVRAGELAPIKGIATTVGSHSIATRFVAVVSDPSKLAREWLMPNQAAIDEALAAAVRRMRAEGKQVPDFHVDGVTVEERESLRRGRGV